MNCTCLKLVFDDMILLRFIMGVEVKEERKEEVGRPMLAWSIAPPRIQDNMVLSMFRVGFIPPTVFSPDTISHIADQLELELIERL